jgi:hypothetical protein
MKQDRWLSDGWHQKALNALKGTLDVNPDFKRAAIQFLYDEGFWDSVSLTWAAAESRYNNCLNPGRPECFKNVELWALQKRFQRFAWLQAMATDCGFELRPIPTAERRQQALIRLVDGVEQAAAVMTEALHELRQQPRDEATRVHQAIIDGCASFALADNGPPSL